MALLGKKSDAPKAPKPAKAPKAKRSFGKKKGDDVVAVAADELAELTGHADPAAAPAPPPPAPPPRRRKLIKNGTMLGLNIGQHSIKAVEVTVKGGSLTITGAGEVPTPGESIANGVVMNTTALAGAIRQLLKVSGIKSRKVVSSVSGTGSLVVRVIEVPRMTDAELVENMSQDAERYIPFPPSEVIMDFKALRELPADPDAPNMEVLLAAAQSEVVDAHINVLGSAKLDPRAVDVEPLAAARSVADLNASLSEDGYIDHYDVSAIINLGATATEISVLRGDLLVFTRSVPKGGNDFTQSLIDHLALPWHDAERLKLEMADALPPQTAPAGTASSDDWSDFGVFDEEATADQSDQSVGQATGFEDFDTSFEAFDDSPVASSTPDTSETAATAPQTSDPFDPDFYQQGPKNREPGEQHGQKENEPFNFDFSDFAGGAGAEKADEAPAAPGAGANVETNAETPADSAFSFSFDETPAAPPVAAPPVAAPPSLAADAAVAHAVTPPASSTPPTPVVPQGDQALPAMTDAVTTEANAGAFSFDSPEEAASWTGAAPTATPAPATPTSKLDLPDFDTLVAESQVEQEEVQSATVESAYDLSEFADIKAPTPASASPVGVAGSATEEDFDLDTLFGGEVADAPGGDFSAFDVGAAPAAPAGAVGAGALAGVAATGTATDDFGFGMGGFENFGAGLSDGADTPMIGIDAATVYSILAPQLEELITEVRRSLEYHASRYPDAAVRRIVLIGGGARMKNLDAYFTQELGIPASIGNPLARLSVKSSQLQPDYINANGPALSVALGLALRDMI